LGPRDPLHSTQHRIAISVTKEQKKTIRAPNGRQTRPKAKAKRGQNQVQAHQPTNQLTENAEL